MGTWVSLVARSRTRRCSPWIEMNSRLAVHDDMHMRAVTTRWLCTSSGNTTCSYRRLICCPSTLSRMGNCSREFRSHGDCFAADSRTGNMTAVAPIVQTALTCEAVDNTHMAMTEKNLELIKDSIIQEDLEFNGTAALCQVNNTMLEHVGDDV